jgi:hypothetical protein
MRSPSRKGVVREAADQHGRSLTSMKKWQDQQ